MSYSDRFYFLIYRDARLKIQVITPNIGIFNMPPSPLPRIVDRESLATTILSGHTSTVLSIDTNLEHGLLASSSKDNTVIIWRQEDGVYVRTATCTGDYVTAY